MDKYAFNTDFTSHFPKVAFFVQILTLENSRQQIYLYINIDKVIGSMQ